jgi:hypothetical protein
MRVLDLGRGAGDASLKMPMLAIGGAWSLGEAVMRSLD